MIDPHDTKQLAALINRAVTARTPAEITAVRAEAEELRAAELAQERATPRGFMKAVDDLDFSSTGLPVRLRTSRDWDTGEVSVIADIGGFMVEHRYAASAIEQGWGFTKTFVHRQVWELLRGALDQAKLDDKPAWARIARSG